MELLLLLQDLRNPALDAVVVFITRLGEELFALVPLLLCYWCIDKRLGLRIGFTFFAGGIANQFSKVIFRVERPFVRNPAVIPHESAIETATGYSFPSGHTTSASSLAMAFAMSFRKKWWVWLSAAVYALSVGFSRMYLGVHTPADVFVGIAMTIVMALLVDFAFADCDRHPKHVAWWFLICGIAATSMMVYAGVKVMQGIVPAAQAKNAFQTGGAALALLLGLILDHKYIHFDPKAKLPVQIIKFILGAALALLFKEGLKPVLGTTLLMQALRYFITVLIVVAGYPWLLTIISKKISAK